MVEEICIKHDNTIKSKNTNQGTPEFPFCISITILRHTFQHHQILAKVKLANLVWA